MTHEANEVLLLTPPGAGAIAVVRLVGPNVQPFLRDCFSRSIAAGRCVHGSLHDGGREIDDPVVVMSADTGSVDINLHGGPWVVQSVIELAGRFGFSLSSNDASWHALDGATVFDREIESAMTLAPTELALRILSQQASAWRQLIKSGDHAATLPRILADRSLRNLLQRPKVAIAGAPNVGKSTLANQLFGQKRSITADVAGTTRDWVGEQANISGLAIELIDTPGIRLADDPIEQQSIIRGKVVIQGASLVILVLDPTQPLAPEQDKLLAAYPGALRVINKCDRQAIWPTEAVDGIHITALNGDGIDALSERILAHFNCAKLDVAQPRCWTDRQAQILASVIAGSRSMEDFFNAPPE